MKFYRPVRLGSGKAISTGTLLCFAFVVLLGKSLDHYLPDIAGMSAESARLCAILVVVTLFMLAVVLQMRHRRQRWQAIMDEQRFAAEVAKIWRETAEKQRHAETSDVPPPPETSDDNPGWP